MIKMDSFCFSPQPGYFAVLYLIGILSVIMIVHFCAIRTSKFSANFQPNLWHIGTILFYSYLVKNKSFFVRHHLIMITVMTNNVSKLSLAI